MDDRHEHLRQGSAEGVQVTWMGRLEQVQHVMWQAWVCTAQKKDLTCFFPNDVIRACMRQTSITSPQKKMPQAHLHQPKK